jgi:hypothetical protein
MKEEMKEKVFPFILSFFFDEENSLLVAAKIKHFRLVETRRITHVLMLEKLVYLCYLFHI